MIYDRVGETAENRTPVFRKGKGWAVIDGAGKRICNFHPDWTYVHPYREGRAMVIVKTDDDSPSVGFLDAGGRLVIAIEFYEGLSGFQDGLANRSALVAERANCGHQDLTV